MQVTKENKIIIYKSSKGGKLDIYLNINGQQLRAVGFPNIEDDLSIRSWGGNIYDNTDTDTEIE